MKIKALSLWQPHADLIALGHKTIETRTWPCRYRGSLLICASKRTSDNADKIDYAVAMLQLPRMLEREQPILPPDYQPRYGVAVAIAKMVDCQQLTSSPEHVYHSCVGSPSGRYGYFLEEVMAIDRPFPVTGRQGIFEVDIDADLLPKPKIKTIMEIVTHPLYTWGYQSRSLADLQALISQYKIESVIDVRMSPRSQYNPDFNKDRLMDAGFNRYCVAPQKFGNRSDSLPWNRPAAWREGCKQVAEELKDHPCLLLCLERDPNNCHRLDVAEAIREMCGCQVIHLGWSEMKKPRPTQMELFR